jgi:thymidylate kinase
LRGVLERLIRLWQPNGLSVVLLGPDGAGKSSIVGAVGPLLAPLFARWTCRWGPFGAPPLLKYLIRHRDDCPTDPNKPHGFAPRSLLGSLARVGYWFAYHTLGYPTFHLALARWSLVLHDRHFVDILVDPRRYRYNGPFWLPRLVWRLIPRPDLIILLDAPAEVLQARKQEVPFEETARQRKAYLSLVQGLRNGRVVDAAQPLEHVVGEVSDIILRHLAKRVQSRLPSKSAVAAGESLITATPSAP